MYSHVFKCNPIFYFNIRIYSYINAILIIIYIKCDILYDYNNYYNNNNK